MVIIPAHDGPEIIGVAGGFLCAVVMVEIDQDSEGENAAEFVVTIITMDIFRNAAVYFGESEV